MRNEQLVNLNTNDLFTIDGEIVHQLLECTESGTFITDITTLSNPSTIVTVLENADDVMQIESNVIANNFGPESIAQPAPQVITIFVPVFGTNQIKLRQMIVGDDWVQTCQDADSKYGVWYTVIDHAIEHIGEFYELDI